MKPTIATSADSFVPTPPVAPRDGESSLLLDCRSPDSAKTLEELAGEIKAEIETVLNHCRQSLEHARRAGECLLLAKAHMVHGQWTSWLRSNVMISARTAQLYMRVADHWDELPTKTKFDTGMTLTQAVELLRKPKAETVSPNHARSAAAITPISILKEDDNDPAEAKLPSWAVEDSDDAASQAIEDFSRALEQLTNNHAAYEPARGQRFVALLEGVKSAIDKAIHVLRSVPTSEAA